MLRFFTAGESHGPKLTAIIDGFPAGLPVDLDRLNFELSRRQGGYGRGSRQKIETDRVEFAGGVRQGKTTGAPVAILIENRDWDNWRHVMSVVKSDLSDPDAVEQFRKKAIRRFRPGHADLAGTFKYRQNDIRDVLERSSARETAARVAVGALCEQLLSQLGIKIVGHVIQVGAIRSADMSGCEDLEKLAGQVNASEMFCADAEATEKIKAFIKETWQEGDTLGGVVEILVDGLPVGLGSYAQWDRRLDGRIAQALMSVQAMKAVEIGDGVGAAGQPGSSVHDALYPATDPNSLPFERKTNRAGGVEGGMTNGSRLVARSYMKPIPTLRKGLPSLSFPDFESETAHFERSDVCAISAASVVAKAMISFVVAREIIEKFGGDTVNDLASSLSRFRNYSSDPASETNFTEIPDSVGQVADSEVDEEPGGESE